MTGIQIQPKPEGSHYITIHQCYKNITDGKVSTAALLSALEYLATSTLANSGQWEPGTALPNSIKILGNCNNPLLAKLLDGFLKPTSIKTKLKFLEEKGFISLELTKGRNRQITYHRKAISEALFDPAKNDRSKIDRSKIDYYPSKSDGSLKNGQQGSIPLGEGDRGGTRQKLTGQKTTTTIPITNHSSIPSEKDETSPSVEEEKTGNELWDFEFESEFWPNAFKKVSVGKAREAYRAARKKASKEKILASWKLVNENDFRQKAEADGTKEYIPMPSTWLNQERWLDEGVVARLEAANSPEAKRQKLLSEVAAELRRLGKRGVVPPGLAPDRNQTYTVSELPIENLQKCLDFLRKQPTPVASPPEVNHAA